MRCSDSTCTRKVFRGKLSCGASRIDAEAEMVLEGTEEDLEEGLSAKGREGDKNCVGGRRNPMNSSQELRGWKMKSMNSGTAAATHNCKYE